MVTTANRIGEVIEASTTQVLAQCYQLYSSPPLGTLIRSGSQGNAIYGIIVNISTQSFEPGRRAIARGHHADNEDELYRENPQLNRLLNTHFTAKTVGYGHGDRFHHNLPPQPPRIHTFVHACDEKEIQGFTESLAFLRLLVSNGTPTDDEATASLLLMATQERPNPYSFRLKAGQELARLLGNEPLRLNSLLERLSP